MAAGQVGETRCTAAAAATSKQDAPTAAPGTQLHRQAVVAAQVMWTDGQSSIENASLRTLMVYGGGIASHNRWRDTSAQRVHQPSTPTPAALAKAQCVHQPSTANNTRSPGNSSAAPLNPVPFTSYTNQPKKAHIRTPFDSQLSVCCCCCCAGAAAQAAGPAGQAAISTPAAQQQQHSGSTQQHYHGKMESHNLCCGTIAGPNQPAPLLPANQASESMTATACSAPL